MATERNERPNSSDGMISYLASRQPSDTHAQPPEKRPARGPIASNDVSRNRRRTTNKKEEERALDGAIGSSIRRRRISHGMSQEQLAAAIGFTFQQIQKYERGTNRVTVSRLVTIAKVLGADPAEILNEAAAESMTACRAVDENDGRGGLALISYYRQLDPKTQSCVRGLLASLAERG